MARLTDEEVEAHFDEKFGKWKTMAKKTEKVICKIDTPQHKKGDIVDRFDLELDRLDYPDVYREPDFEEKVKWRVAELREIALKK